MIRVITPLLIMMVFASSACRENEFQPPPPPTVSVSTPLRRDVVEYAEITGTTESFRTVEVRARVQGILQEIAYTPGTEVAEGDFLFKIDEAPFAAARDAALARVTNEEAQVRLTDTTALRTERSAQDGAVSELQALEARAKADAAVTQLEVARKELAIQQLDVDYTEIRAPISGRIERSPFTAGSLVGGIDSSLLTKIYDDSKIYAWFSVPDRIFLMSRQDQESDQLSVPVELATEVDQGFPHVGEANYIDPTVDSSTGTVRVRAVFENQDRSLVAGLFVRCRIAVRTISDAMLVPDAAIGVDQIGHYVFVVDDQAVVERRDVELGPVEGELRVVLDGLAPTDRVIVRGILRARPGSTVQVQVLGS
ncbi:MAG: efflux RND transporter periplasmic adaptor subunit [Phycisphaerales bacterium JB043]